MLFSKKDSNNTEKKKTAGKSKKKWLIATIAGFASVADFDTLMDFNDNAEFYLVGRDKRVRKIIGGKIWEATLNGVTIRVTELTLWWQDWIAERVA